MKRYLLFAGETNSPSGGEEEDFIKSFDDKKEAIKAGGDKIATNNYDWFDVFDVELGRTVAGGSK